MSETALKRIEKSLRKLADQQDVICAKLASLEQRLDASGTASRASTAEVIAFLDQFRAGESLGEASLGAWIEVSDTPCVKGALRTIQMREGSHAALLEQRVKELGGSPTAEVPEAIYDAAMTQSASREKSDTEKVRDFVARFPDVDAALKPIHDLADRLDHDQETQSLLRAIAQDERSTLEFLHDACRQLGG
jgi:hypothetical protein